VYTIDLRRPSLLNRITSDGLVNGSPIWNSSGDKLVFHSDRDGLPELWTQAADGSSAASPLLEVSRSGFPADWSGNSLIFSGYGQYSNWVLKGLETSGTPQPRILWDSGTNAVWGFLSPDRRWLLYGSDKMGIVQICIRPWPDLTLPEKQISIQGGSDPLWHPEGREIFYRDGNQFMKVAVPASLEGWIPKPELMFRKNYRNAIFKPWAIMPDGRHFIMLQPTHPDPPGTELHLVQNWFEELKQKVPAGR
jgi:Tol biopolymer transport system component